MVPGRGKKARNVHRVLAAIGCLPPGRINDAAVDIYRAGVHVSGTGLRIRLVAVGRERSKDLAAQYPAVAQLIWPVLLAFIWDRFRNYRNQTINVDQWDAEGRKIKRLADQSGEPRENLVSIGDERNCSARSADIGRIFVGASALCGPKSDCHLACKNLNAD
jgi:hypothetical protein